MLYLTGDRRLSDVETWRQVRYTTHHCAVSGEHDHTSSCACQTDTSALYHERQSWLKTHIRTFRHSTSKRVDIWPEQKNKCSSRYCTPENALCCTFEMAIIQAVSDILTFWVTIVLYFYIKMCRLVSFLLPSCNGGLICICRSPEGRLVGNSL